MEYWNSKQIAGGYFNLVSSQGVPNRKINKCRDYVRLKHDLGTCLFQLSNPVNVEVDQSHQRMASLHLSLMVG